MKVAITGGSGFVGSNLTEYLIETEPHTDIVVVDTAPPRIELPLQATYIPADVRNLRSLIDAFQDCEEVYHLAGILGTSELLSQVSLACDVNVTGTSTVLDACILAGVKRVYNVAKPHYAHLAENAYTLTKHTGELLGWLYREQFDLDVATVRWMNVVGPYQHLYPVRKLVPMALLSALHGLDVEIFGSGEQTIDPIDVKDLSRFTVHACRHMGQLPEVHDLGSGVGITVNLAAEIILDIVRSIKDTPSQIVHVPMRVGETDHRRQADLTYWQDHGMQAEVPFEESVRKTLIYIETLPHYMQMNALRHFGKVV